MKAANYSARALGVALVSAVTWGGISGSLSAQRPTVRNDATRAATADNGARSRIELPTNQVIANTAAQPLPTGGFVNPKVPAGNVRWHSSYATARKAAEKSGKPVLLFQMMGKLDDQFC